MYAGSNHDYLLYMTKRKNISKINKEVGMLLQKRPNTSGVGISNIMRKSIIHGWALS